MPTGADFSAEHFERCFCCCPDIACQAANSWLVGITGQSLPALEDLDFASLRRCMPLSHFPPRRTSFN